jgi:hypothetical protein
MLSDAADTDEVEIFVDDGENTDFAAYYEVRKVSQVSGADSPPLWCIDAGGCIQVS